MQCSYRVRYKIDKIHPHDNLPKYSICVRYIVKVDRLLFCVPYHMDE